MKGRTKPVISMVLVIALLLTSMISTSLFSGMSAKAAAVSTTVVDDGTFNIDFNDDWKFQLGTRTPSVSGSTTAERQASFVANGVADVPELLTADVIRNDYDDSGWRTLSVPHDFSIEGPKLAGESNAQGYLQAGLGWYRKTFVLPTSMQGKHFTIDFEGIHQNSIVYLNGELVGNYPNGYTGFAYDITSGVRFGDDNPNVLVVKVQNMSPSGRWYTGSGIIRPVHLIVNNDVRFVRNGIQMSSPDLQNEYTNYNSATLNVAAKFFSTVTDGSVRMQTTVLDRNGAVVAQNWTASYNANAMTSGNMSTYLDIQNVQLWYPWNLGDPYLYTVKTDLYHTAAGSTEKLVDSNSSKYGFRWFRVDGYNASNPNMGGMYVNGKYTKINGVDLHHDAGALGAASNKDAYARQWDVLISMGVNSYRTSHCPPAKQIIEVCSEKGIIVGEEAYDGWNRPRATFDFGNFFHVTVPTNWRGFLPNGFTQPPNPAVNYAGAEYTWSDWVIREMVARDMNEASVLMFSVGNEVGTLNAAPAWYNPAAYDSAALNVGGTISYGYYTESVRLAAEVKRTAPGHLIFFGTNQQKSAPAFDSDWGRVNRYLDGVGLNYNTATSVDSLMTNFPSTSRTFFFESESSSQTSARGVYLDPHIKNSGINQTPGRRGGSSYDNDFASWTMSNEYGLQKDRDRKAFMGQYIWSGFDYIGEPTPYNVYPTGVSSFGTIDTAGFPKDSYYLFRSQWTDKTEDPMVHIVPGNWNDWQEGEMVEVWVNSNVQTVELFQDGVSLGTKSFDIKKTDYGKEYYETSELNRSDKSWPNSASLGNPTGYVSNNATIVSASGDSVIEEGAKFGKLHLTWMVPFKKGSLTAKAYTSPTKTTLVAEDKVVTAGAAYTVKLSANKEVIKADGRSLTYVEVTVVDKDGNVVPKANNLLKFDVTGGAIVGVDNGAPESAEMYKWGGVERNNHSERSAFSGKALVILQSNKGEVGTMKLTVSSDGFQNVVKNIAVTADGTGEAPPPAALNPTVVSIRPTQVATRFNIVPTLPAYVYVNYTDETAGEYSVKQPVIWDELTAADLKVPPNGDPIVIEGTVAGVSKKAICRVYPFASVATGDTVKDIALNTALGNNSQVYDFATLAADSPIRDGALATATYTSGTSFYPNNMLNGSTSNYWNNIGNRGANTLLPVFNWARTRDNVEFYWDSARVFGQINMEFNVSGEQYVVPTTLNVQYWNGLEWVNASNQAVTKATEAYGVTTITFSPVNSDRVRVEMTSSTANWLEGGSATSVTGALQIRGVNIMGWNLSKNMPALQPTPESVSLDQSELAVFVTEDATLTKTVAPEDAVNRVIWSSSDETVATVDASGKVTGVKAGTATITATTVEGGFTDTCIVTVRPLETYKINTGETVSIPITVKDCVKLAGLKATVQYDEELLTLDSIIGKSGFIIQSRGNTFVMTTNEGEGVDGDTVIGYLIFIAKANLSDDVTTYVQFPKNASIGYDEAGKSGSVILPTIQINIISVPPMRGDVTLDGKVDLSDVVLLMQYIAGSIDLNDKQLRAADTNNDGAVNVGDSIIIMQMCLK